MATRGRDKGTTEAPGDRPLDVEADRRRRTEGLPPEAPRGVRVEELMTSELVTALPSQPADEAARLMRDHNLGFLPICQSDCSPVGVVTDRDLVVRLLADAQAATTRLEEVMTADPICCHAGDDVAVAEQLMSQNQVSRLPVLDDDDLLVGVVSLADLAQYEEECRVGEVLADVTTREAEPH
jgi:CBS domain-containing protein